MINKFRKLLNRKTRKYFMLCKGNKKTIKINFKYFWRGFTPYYNFFSNLLRRHYNVVIENKADFVIYSVFDHPMIDRSFKMPVLEGNFIKIFYTGENCRPDMNKCDWAFSFDYDEELNHPRHLRLPYYKLCGAGENLIKKNLDIEQIKKEKTKFCNFLYSYDWPFRNEFFKKLSKYKKIDAGGKCFNNMFMGLRIRRKDTVKFMKKYKFTIAFENVSYPGYTTEKIYNAMRINSIPIYWGNPLIHRDFNTKSFINYYDFYKRAELEASSLAMDRMVKRIIEIDNDDKLYEQYLKEPWYNNNKLSIYTDFRLIEKRFKEIFG